MLDNLQHVLRRRYAQDYGRSSYFWEIRRHGLVVIAEFDLFGDWHSLEAEAPPGPYEFHARAYRSVEGVLQHQFITIEPGMTPIWRHTYWQATGVMESDFEYEESLVFGRRRHPNGREEVRRVFPDGFFMEFSSMDLAQAYVRPRQKPERFVEGVATIIKD